MHDSLMSKNNTLWMELHMLEAITDRNRHSYRQGSSKQSGSPFPDPTASNHGLNLEPEFGHRVP
ncbi:hypothetical protein L195_g024102 [Trifolium pratense]|uniref:Uncharacterized protein n=1 Tax=Trifolium pratense TaxID=57577 RepID=A0A2K3NCR6_TRIPR|nr:hypothetical protein L195_g024102 [Trifolium pratense]